MILQLTSSYVTVGSKRESGDSLPDSAVGEEPIEPDILECGEIFSGLGRFEDASITSALRRDTLPTAEVVFAKFTGDASTRAAALSGWVFRGAGTGRPLASVYVHSFEAK